MRINKQIVYAIIAVVLVGGVIATIALTRGDKQVDTTEQNQDTDNQSQDRTSITDVNKQVTGCYEGPYNYEKDERGRFKPTKEISNKVVTMETTMGTIKVELYDKDAPKTVQNFVCLVEKGFYNGITFHRVSRNFVIQAGDPTGTGRGGGSIYGTQFEDELYTDTPSYKAGYKKGVLAMANSGQNTNSSQFFIMLNDINLPHNYTIFGKVIEGLDVVEKIGAVPVTPVLDAEDGTPKTPVVINKATVDSK